MTENPIKRRKNKTFEKMNHLKRLKLFKQILMGYRLLKTYLFNNNNLSKKIK